MAESRNQLPLQSRFEFSEEIYKLNITYKPLDFNYNPRQKLIEHKVAKLGDALEFTISKFTLLQ